MTGMEQCLRYIEREIRFMVKDQFGNPTYTKYADRVIEDACGIPSFCTTVLSSTKPLAAILRVVRGPRGDIIMKFFSSALHDTRIEMVMVLAEVVKLRAHHNRSAKNSHDYLMKLYKKANKRMVRLITGSKNKESIKSMYRGLRNFAKMDDFDYEDDDADEIDDYFNGINEFGDSDYAETCLDAYRDGKTPPVINVDKNHLGRLNPHLTGNEEILHEIAKIEANLGRQLTDAELDNILCGDDDDDIYSDIGAVQHSSDKMIDLIVDVIYNRLIEKLNLNDPNPNTQNYESLNEFINRQPSNDTNNFVQGVPDTTAISDDASIDDSNGNRIMSTNNAKDPNSDESDTDDSNCLPPSNTLGGNFNEADFIDVGYDDSSLADSDDKAGYESSTEGLIASTEESSPQMQNMLILGDIINDLKVVNGSLSDNFINRFKNYFERIGINLIDSFVSLVPSNGNDKLFTLIVSISVNGDYEIINMMHLNTIVLMHTKLIAERFGISENLIDTEFNVIDSNSTLEMNLKALNTLNKNYTPKSVGNVYSMLSVLSAYLYTRLGKLIEVRFIDDPRYKEINVYFSSKTDEPLGADFEEFIQTELCDEGILDEIITEFSNNNHRIVCHISNDDDEFFNRVQSAIDYQVRETPLINRYITSNKEFIRRKIESFDIEIDDIRGNADTSIGHKNVYLDIIYRIYTKKSLSQSQKTELENQLETNGEYSVELENVIRSICMNIQVNNFIEVSEVCTDDTEITDVTSNFGI